MTTPEWRAIDDTNQLIEFYPTANWQAFTGVNPASVGWTDIWENSYHSTTQTGSTFFIQFHGDGIDFWSHVLTGDNGQFIMRLDGGALETVMLNNTEPNPRLPIWQKAGLTLGDHEIIGRFVSTGSGGVGYLDSFAVHNSLYATDGFDLQTVGPAALNVPSNANVVDNGDPTVSYSGHWTHANSVEFYQHTTAWTTTPGDTFTFTFTGTAIWYYADLDPVHAPVSISVDGGTPDIAVSTGTTGNPLSRRLIWSKQGLDNKLHTLIATHAGDAGHAISLDFFRVLGFASAPPAPSAPPSSGNSGQQSSGSSTPTQAATVTGSGSVTTSQTESGSQHYSSTGDTFKPTIIITGTGTGTSSNHAQITGDGIGVSGIQEQQSQPQNSSSNIGVVAGSTIGAAAIIVFVVMFLLWYRRTSQRKHTSLSSTPSDPAEPYDVLRLESARYTKRDRFLASQTPQMSLLRTRDMEERAGGFGAAPGGPVSTSLIDVTSPSVTASHTAQSTSIGSQQELHTLHSPAPPPYER